MMKELGILRGCLQRKIGNRLRSRFSMLFGLLIVGQLLSIVGLS